MSTVNKAKPLDEKVLEKQNVTKKGNKKPPIIRVSIIEEKEKPSSAGTEKGLEESQSVCEHSDNDIISQSEEKSNSFLMENLTVNDNLYNNIPSDLKSRKQWVVYEENPKKPINVSTGYGDTKDQTKWATFNEALDFYNKHKNDITGYGIKWGVDNGFYVLSFALNMY